MAAHEPRDCVPYLLHHLRPPLTSPLLHRRRQLLERRPVGRPRLLREAGRREARRDPELVHRQLLLAHELAHGAARDLHGRVLAGAGDPVDGDVVGGGLVGEELEAVVEARDGVGHDRDAALKALDRLQHAVDDLQQQTREVSQTENQSSATGSAAGCGSIMLNCNQDGKSSRFPSVTSIVWVSPKPNQPLNAAERGSSCLRGSVKVIVTIGTCVYEGMVSDMVVVDVLGS